MIIVDPETATPCQDTYVGEIWVAGPSVAQGYWHRKEETEKDFPCLSTMMAQDHSCVLAISVFRRHDELFITGRIKDLIIIRGSNHYPQDIEYTVENCHAALRSPGCAAFSVDIAGEERLVVVQEVERTALTGNLEEVDIGYTSSHC